MDVAIRMLQEKLGVSPTGAYEAETHTAHLKAIGCVSLPTTMAGWEALLHGTFADVSTLLAGSLEATALAFAKAGLPVVEPEVIASTVEAKPELAISAVVAETPVVEVEAEPKAKRPRRK
jgi:hypothetical protein